MGEFENTKIFCDLLTCWEWNPDSSVVQLVASHLPTELMCICCILCVFVIPYVFLLYYTCIAVLTLDAGLLARSQYPEGPATGHLDTGFS